MGTVTCPKCGNRQDGGDDCESCGIVFARFQAQEAEAPSALLPVGAKGRNRGGGNGSSGLFRKLIKLTSWAALAAVLVVMFLILKPKAPPEVDVDAASAKRVESAQKGLDRAVRRKRPYTLVMNEADLNHWLKTNLVMGDNANGQGATGSTGDARGATGGATSDVQKRAVNRVMGGALAKIPSQIGGAPAGAGRVSAPPVTAPMNQMQPTLREVRSSVRDVRINLSGDKMEAYLLFDLFGKDLTLELEGKLVSQDGYLRLQPTAGRIGSFPIPMVALNNAVTRLFDSPENREQFRLADSVTDIRIEGGRFMLKYR